MRMDTWPLRSCGDIRPRECESGVDQRSASDEDGAAVKEFHLRDRAIVGRGADLRRSTRQATAVFADDSVAFNGTARSIRMNAPSRV